MSGDNVNVISVMPGTETQPINIAYALTDNAGHLGTCISYGPTDENSSEQKADEYSKSIHYDNSNGTFPVELNTLFEGFVGPLVCHLLPSLC